MEERTRCFVCIDFPSEVVKEVVRLQDILGKQVFDGKMTELENLHLTLKFLGGVDEGKLEEVKKKLEEIKMDEFDAKVHGNDCGTLDTRELLNSCNSLCSKLGKFTCIQKSSKKQQGLFDTRLTEVGVFSFKGKPKIVWVKVGGEEIRELQRKVDAVLSEVGFKVEERFMSHLTIARVKYVKSPKEFIDYVNGMKCKETGFSVKGFKLMKSELRSPGPVYSCLEEYGLD